MISQYIFLGLSLVAVVLLEIIIKKFFNSQGRFFEVIFFFSVYGIAFLFTKNSFAYFDMKKKSISFVFLITSIILAILCIKQFSDS